jgi:ribosomal protein L7Ae-like RNA K-turn-binding protein
MKAVHKGTKNTSETGAFKGSNVLVDKASTSALITPSKDRAKHLAKPVSGQLQVTKSDSKKVRASKVGGLEKYRILSSSDKDECLRRLRSCIDLGLLGSHAGMVKLGFNAVMKAVERSRATIICGFRDSPAILVNALFDSARYRGVPLVVFPKCSQEFAALLGVKKLSCFAFTTIDPLDPDLKRHSDDSARGDGSDIVLEGQIDALRELLLERASAL